jgi:hypothetical protein
MPMVKAAPFQSHLRRIFFALFFQIGLIRLHSRATAGRAWLWASW